MSFSAPSNLQTPLQIGGVAANAAVGGSGKPQVITGLAAHGVWVTSPLR